MKISWEYSLESEARRIVHTAHQIAVGFYRINGFFVLPYDSNSRDVSSNLVYFPDLPYYKISRFWEKMKRIDVYHIPFKVEQKILDQLVEMIKEARLPRPESEKMEQVWNKMEKEFLGAVTQVIPKLMNSVKNMVIMPTILGTKCSFTVPKQFPAMISMYLRNDGDMIYGMVEAILSALTRDNIYKKLQASWQESEMLVDWLISESAIGEVINKYHSLKYYSPTLKNIRSKQSALILKQSDEFYRKLGLPSFEKPFRNENGVPKLFDKTIENISISESSVLNKLIENENRVTPVDTVAEVMFKSENDFSLYAISKTIQRLRDKLEKNGISGSCIQTLRTKGFVLRN